MRIGIVTDATCDLPADFLRRHRVGILPVTLRLGADFVLDERDPTLTLDFHRRHQSERGAGAETLAPSAAQIRAHFLDQAVLDYDYVFCLTAMASRSPIHRHATDAAFALLDDYRAVRAAAGVPGPFGLRVIDSRSLSAGTGLLVAEACRLAGENRAPEDIRARIEDLRERLTGYLLPHDLNYWRRRARNDGERRLSAPGPVVGRLLGLHPVLEARQGHTGVVRQGRGFGRTAESLFTEAAAAVERGLETPYVTLAYGGEGSALAALPGYERLAQAAARQGVELLGAVMSATTAIDVGTGALALAWTEAA